MDDINAADKPELGDETDWMRTKQAPQREPVYHPGCLLTLCLRRRGETLTGRADLPVSRGLRAQRPEAARQRRPTKVSVKRPPIIREICEIRGSYFGFRADISCFARRFIRFFQITRLEAGQYGNQDGCRYGSGGHPCLPYLAASCRQSAKPKS
jgi:hypothetical protein